MREVDARDGDRVIDWSGASGDYARHRPRYPTGMFDRLAALGVGLPGQSVLDLGTGTGFVALELAGRGCDVVGVDVAPGQIEEARRLAAAEELAIRYEVGAAEDVDFPAGAFDLITAGQCWLYFDADRIVPLVTRLLARGGSLVTLYFSWLPRLDEIARASEGLVLRHNPDWTAADWSGEVAVDPVWARDHFRVTGFFCYDGGVPFTRESWRGRIRASRGVSATLSPADVARFDDDHARLLERIAPPRFEVLHRMSAHVLEPVERGTP